MADHDILGHLLLPAAALVELALLAGARLGADTVEELLIGSPLSLPASGGVALQVQIGGPDAEGRRSLSVHSRPQDAALGSPGPVTPTAPSWLPMSRLSRLRTPNRPPTPW
nr:polyketide synthase dehydratase domain-containing protein [Streptomyces sp. RKAG290]